MKLVPGKFAIYCGLLFKIDEELITTAGQKNSLQLDKITIIL